MTAKLSDTIRALPDQFASSEITIGQLKEVLSGRAYGLLLLVLALPNLIPLPTPGLSATVGAPLLLVTMQLAMGMKGPWLPAFMARRRMKREDVARVCGRVAAYLARLEVLFRPRLRFLIRPPADRLIAFLCAILSFLIMMPVPFGNALPAVAICLFALALLQSDGLFVIFGLLASVVSATAIAAALSAAFGVVSRLTSMI